MGMFSCMVAGAMIITVGLLMLFIKEPVLPPERIRVMTKRAKVIDLFASIIKGYRNFTKQLKVFALIFFCLTYGYYSYGGTKGQFFGIFVNKGKTDVADHCGADCDDEQKAYLKGVRIAGGLGELISSSIGYVFLFLVPYLVRTFGSKKIHHSINLASDSTLRYGLVREHMVRYRSSRANDYSSDNDQHYGFT